MSAVPTDSDSDSQPNDVPEAIPRPYLLAGLRGDSGMAVVSMGRWQGKALVAVGLALIPVIALAILLPRGGSADGDPAALPGTSEAAARGGGLPLGAPNPANQVDLAGNSTSTPSPGSPLGTPSAGSGSPQVPVTGTPDLPPGSTAQAPPPGGTAQTPPPGTPAPPQDIPAPPPGTPAQTPSPGKTTSPAASTGRPIVSHDSGKCLQATAKDGAAVQIWSCDGSAKQQWSVGSDGSLRTGGFCLDAPWGATDDGTTLQVARCNGGSAQKFALNSAHDIVGRQSGSCLDVRDFSTANGAAVQLWSCTGADNQKWSWR
ncbi:ricin-type beta-trefoil lectin domain protein [Micromonospora violae]|uniref:ricin-type beta-trefoil lectin domain protein n=1 Tax=Micromonospora violae TaxID=1278207 RepID=UPI0033D7DD88